MEQDAQALELFEGLQVLPQDVSISRDFLSPDTHVLHAQLKKIFTRDKNNKNNNDNNAIK
jgi:hypothetical protein